jgi:hypothetical protein
MSDINPVELADRLARFEEGLKSLIYTVKAIDVKVGIQNARVDSLEDETLRAQARRDVRRQDIAVIAFAASVIPSVIAAAAIFIS